MALGLNTSNFLPRRYQEEIFLQARDSNTIAALDTGSGKTFISTLLIKWIVSQESSRGKVVVFIVPKVALVIQQGEFIMKHTPLRVSMLHGSTEIDLADRSNWRQEFDRNDVLVMTAQIFLNILTHAHWSIDKVSLMVFDECHHTQKNHPYNGIMREYFQVSHHLRPKIFGMTASPIWNPKDATGSLAALERNLDATVIGVRDHVEELLGHSPKPIEIIREYPPPTGMYDYPSPMLWDCLGIFDLPEDMELPMSKVQIRYQVTLRSLGPYCAELFLYTHLKHRIAQLKMQPAGLSINMINHGIAANIDSEDIFSPGLREAEEIISNYAPFFERDHDPAIPLLVPLSWCSPKISVLVDILASHEAPFQGIIFVEQRQVAACLATVLPCISELKGQIRCAALVGHGSSTNASAGDQIRGMGLKLQKDAVNRFREGELNLLVATAVAEEGLDFPECDIVIRFDRLQHMVGYLQSRGRARNKMSTYVIMVQKDLTNQLELYRSFSESEPELRRTYQEREEGGDEEDEMDDPADIEERERYVVPSSGATLTYDISISLLAYLCSLIPRDRYTPVHLPRYNGDFQSRLSLPSTLPLPPSKLVYLGPMKRTKQEAKRAVAFHAIKELHALEVFDDYLLPASSARARGSDDADGRPLGDVKGIPAKLDVMVRNPWTDSEKLWVHVVDVDGWHGAGIVTGTELLPVTVSHGGLIIRTWNGSPVEFNQEDEQRQRYLMREYMKLGIWYCNTGRPIVNPLTAFLVPLTSRTQPDYHAMKRLVDSPIGSYDWSGIGELHYGRLMVTNDHRWGQTYIMTRIRYDMTALSTPVEGSREARFPTYRDYWMKKWTTRKRAPNIPIDCPLVETRLLQKQTSAKYTFGRCPKQDSDILHSTVSRFIPLGCCRWIDLPYEMHRTFEILPVLLRRITDIYRARQARFELCLPPILDNLLVEALTIPTALAGFNNQRFETIGDSLLKLAVTVHVYNKFPYRHEGQLDILRRNSITNRMLLARARDIDLERFVTSEVSSVYAWRYVAPERTADIEVDAIRSTRCEFPRRSLQDCMEATLGAAFVTGGIPLALRAGDALGLAFGGSQPWSVRYSRRPEPSSIPALFTALEATLGYEFHRGELLVEAVTHPSFSSSTNPSYQRLEFLGDAVIDLVVMKYLYNKFSEATSGQMSLARSRAVCAPTLASLAVRRLGLHRIMLINSVELSMAINQYVPFFESVSAEDIIHTGWKYDPPKALSDVFESIVGAVLVDSAWNFEKAQAVVEEVMSDILELLSPSMPKDPVSELLLWAASTGCTRIVFQKSKSSPSSTIADSISVLVHDDIVAGPLTGTSMQVVKGLVAERASLVLRDPGSEKGLHRLCDCQNRKKQVPDPDPDPTADVELLENIQEEGTPADETESGFAALAQTTLHQFAGYTADAEEEVREDDSSAEDDQDENKPEDCQETDGQEEIPIILG